MDINTAGWILVYVLSACLIVFLGVSILIVVRILALIRQIKRVVDVATKAAEKAEYAGEFFQRVTTHHGMWHSFFRIIDAIISKEKEGKKK